MLKSRTSSSGGLSDVDIRPGYERKVGFDTMTDADDTPNGYFTFCLQVKSRGYTRTKNTRTFMCAVDDNTYSERALEWLMESLVSDGDEIVAVRVLEGEREEIDQEAARDEARELMASIVQLNDEVGRQCISIVVEFVSGLQFGKVTNSILGFIYIYRPDGLTVGKRGKSVSAIQKMLGGSSMGSVSRDILNRCPVPVVIVRPEAKVRKHLVKRQNDPKRRSYHDLVALGKEENLPLSVGGKHHSHRILPHGLHLGGGHDQA
jgi:nucleotide-binding universal stress UspA family protein